MNIEKIKEFNILKIEFTFKIRTVVGYDMEF